jgi:hypothetical protein
MKTRPWPLVVLAVLQIGAPAASILMSAFAYQTSPFQVLYWLFQRPLLEIFEFFFLMPIAGVAIYQMKRWSYVVFFATMAWSLWTKMRHWDFAMGSVSTGLLLGVYGAQGALALYFLLPAVRRTYFDPAVRWWESLPRFMIHAPASIQKGGVAYESKIFDLSEGGARVRCATPLVPGEELVLSFMVLSRSFSVPSRVLHVLQTPADGQSFGVSFMHNEQSAAQFKGLARGLGMMGFPDRQERRPFLQSLREWGLRLVKTGKGFLPEPKFRGPIKKN